MNPAPIGVFDSGVGGLSILRAIRMLLPHEHLLYVADSGHVPYGTKTQAYLQERVFTLTDFLRSQGAKALVIACNTATVATVADLRATIAMPIVAVEPAIKPAVAVTQTGVVGVMATAATLASAQFSFLREQFGGDVTILPQPCPRLVQQVEAGELNGPTTRSLIQHYTSPLVDQGADTLVLGCTHFPFLRPLIEEVVGANTTIIDTGSAVARQLSRVLSAQNLLGCPAKLGTQEFWTSGDVGVTQSVMSALWGQPVHVSTLPQRISGYCRV